MDCGGLQTAMNLPGYMDAPRLGYSLLSYGGEKKSATYVKSDVWLTVYADSTAELSSMIGIVKLSIDRFQFPHPRFAVFEKKIRSIIDNCQ